MSTKCIRYKWFKAREDTHESCLVCAKCTSSLPCGMCAMWSEEVWAAIVQKAAKGRERRNKSQKGKRICLTKHGSSYSGWLILHNPKYEPVGYRVTVGKKVNVKLGQLKHQEQFLDFIHVSDIEEVEQTNEAIVEWIPLDLGHKYSSKELEKSLKAMQGKFRHILKVELFDAS